MEKSKTQQLKSGGGLPLAIETIKGECPLHKSHQDHPIKINVLIKWGREVSDLIIRTSGSPPPQPQLCFHLSTHHTWNCNRHKLSITLLIHLLSCLHYVSHFLRPSSPQINPSLTFNLIITNVFIYFSNILYYVAATLKFSETI